MAFRVRNTDNKAPRVGELRLSHSGSNMVDGAQTISTPNCFLHTRYGLPACLTPDLMKHLPETPILLHASIPQIYEQTQFMEDNKLDLFEFVGLTKNQVWTGPECAIASSFHDLLTSSELPNSETEFSFDTPAGRKKITPEGFVSVTQTLQTQIVIAPFPEVDVHSSKKRVGKAVKHTTTFLQHVFDHINTNNIANMQRFWPAIIGCNHDGDLASRTVSLDDFAKVYQKYNQYVAGVYIVGLNNGETFEQTQQILQHCVNTLPKDLPRLVSGLEDPIQVLGGVQLGTDLFTSAYPFITAEIGYALTFQYHMHDSAPCPDIFLNIRDKSLSTDWTPLLPGCECYCCTNHTRAYLHHLLATHELLANIMLNLHNTYHYLQFFKTIREQIEQNHFDQYHEWFATMWHGDHNKISQ